MELNYHMEENVKVKDKCYKRVLLVEKYSIKRKIDELVSLISKSLKIGNMIFFENDEND